MAGRVIALPQFPQGVLPADIPDLEVHIWQRNGGYILSDCGDCFEIGNGVGREEEGFDLFVESGLAGVVEAEEEDGVFCGVLAGNGEGGKRCAEEWRREMAQSNLWGIYVAGVLNGWQRTLFARSI